MAGWGRGFALAGLSTFAVAAPSGRPAEPPRSLIMPARAVNDQPLSVMTYNVKGLPWPIAWGREPALTRIADRLATLRQHGRQPHIVLLQEAFVPQATAIAARAGYRYFVAGPDATLRTPIPAEAADLAYLKEAYRHRGERLGKALGSGLMILSDYPITGRALLAFPDFACAGFDCLANKGVVIADLRVPGVGMVSVVNTHFNARAAAGVPVDRSQRAFDRQAELLANFVYARVQAGRTLVLGGDVNIGTDPARRRAFFARFARAEFSFVLPELGGLKRSLRQRAWADTRAHRDLVHADQHGADWLFARGIGGAPLPVIDAQVPFGAEADGEPLSDHHGYQIGYASPRPRLLSKPNPGFANISTRANDPS